MDARKLIASLCYFSIFFAGFLVPVIVYFVTNDGRVREHAKKALLSHLLPFLSLIFFLIIWMATISVTSTIFLGVISLILYFVVMIWNVIKGIQVLLER
ncbi:hypothetical protein YDYSG_18480 [Paenibacillus tyrfis]|uniref:DUF4870 domain-containing protein n=1 Tax=Paenibacillus tyrfis TaxID=1501230 RepID=UPI0024927F32|nr:DUF4870 domain-containing protein [Paenibacillus tyrfis]GLI05818.1 hypothetical protein YDYSG_18480 [Paenibacillus tyrfis]